MNAPNQYLCFLLIILKAIFHLHGDALKNLEGWRLGRRRLIENTTNQSPSSASGSGILSAKVSKGVHSGPTAVTLMLAGATPILLPMATG